MLRRHAAVCALQNTVPVACRLGREDVEWAARQFATYSPYAIKQKVSARLRGGSVWRKLSDRGRATLPLAPPFRMI